MKKLKIIDQVKLNDFLGTKEEQLQSLFNQWYGCLRCSLSITRDPGGDTNEIVFGEGNKNADVLIVGEAPGEEEEKSSIPFKGRSGVLLNQLIAETSDNEDIVRLYKDFYNSPKAGKKGEANIKEFNDRLLEYRHREFFITNTIGCRPPENRTPTFNEISICWERLWNIIYIVDPLLIIACGNTALSALMGKVHVTITKMRGNIYDLSYNGKIGSLTYPVFATYHPSYLLRKADWNIKGGDWAKTVEDWRKALKVLDFLRNKNFGTPIPIREKI